MSRDPYRLTPMERRLLDYLQTHPDCVHTRTALLCRVWGIDAAQNTRTVDQHIAALRRKCGLYDELITVYKRGYLFQTK